MKIKENEVEKPYSIQSYDPRTRIGFLAIANAGIIENDMFSMCPKDVYLHFTRIPMNSEININNLAGMVDSIGNAVETIMPGRNDIDVLCYNCTSASFIIGEDIIKQKIEAYRNNVIATTMLSGVVAALEILKVKKIAIGTAYTSDINTLEQQYFENKGFDVVKMAGMDLLTDVEMNNIKPEQIINFAISIDSPDAEAIFLSCGALRSTEVIKIIESIINKPVITSNQASFWNCLRLAGINDRIQGYGQLFELY